MFSQLLVVKGERQRVVFFRITKKSKQRLGFEEELPSIPLKRKRSGKGTKGVGFLFFTKFTLFVKVLSSAYVIPTFRSYEIDVF